MSTMKKKARESIIVAVMLAGFAAVTCLVFHYKLDSLGRIEVIQVAMDFFGMSLGIILFIICIKRKKECGKFSAKISEG